MSAQSRASPQSSSCSSLNTGRVTCSAQMRTTGDRWWRARTSNRALVVRPHTSSLRLIVTVNKCEDTRVIATRDLIINSHKLWIWSEKNKMSTMLTKCPELAEKMPLPELIRSRKYCPMLDPPLQICLKGISVLLTTMELSFWTTHHNNRSHVSQSRFRPNSSKTNSNVSSRNWKLKGWRNWS